MKVKRRKMKIEVFDSKKDCYVYTYKYKDSLGYPQWGDIYISLDGEISVVTTEDNVIILDPDRYLLYVEWI